MSGNIHPNKFLQFRYNEIKKEPDRYLLSWQILKVLDSGLSTKDPAQNETVLIAEQEQQNALLPECNVIPAHIQTASDAFKLKAFNNMFRSIQVNHMARARIGKKKTI